MKLPSSPLSILLPSRLRLRYMSTDRVDSDSEISVYSHLPSQLSSCHLEMSSSSQAL